jgi:ABC-type Zn uptake system ZnuABC Zn-binding protein ZnuA
MKRKELWSGGDAHAYELTARDMEEIWEAERHVEEGIIEEHSVEEGD